MGSAPIEMSCRDEVARLALIECAARRFWERQSTTGINRVAAPTNHRMRKTVVVQMRKNATNTQLCGEAAVEVIKKQRTPAIRPERSSSPCNWKRKGRKKHVGVMSLCQR